jgi:hypothetical protein
MCCTFFESKLSDTILYAAESELEGRRVHVMAYQNRAKNLAKGPNAMLLPIPAAKPLTPDNMLDTRLFKRILSHYVTKYEAAIPRPQAFGIGKDMLLSTPAKAEVFERGSFTVVLAQDARLIPAALARVPEHRRPAPNRAIFSAYAKHYPGWHMALCCYDGAIEAEPMVFWYEPLFPKRLFAPALDAHDGNPPDLNRRVHRDHYVFFAAKQAKRGILVDKERLVNTIPLPHQPLFVDHFAGAHLTGTYPNGDFWLDVQDLNQEVLGFETLPPPGVMAGAMS